MKKFLIFLVVVIAGIQFIPVEQTNPPVENDLFASNEVKDILKRACYDCHSNETNWAWYTKVAPMSWLAASDVNGGRENLNFSEWENIGTMDQKKITRFVSINKEADIFTVLLKFFINVNQFLQEFETIFMVKLLVINNQIFGSFIIVVIFILIYFYHEFLVIFIFSR